MNPKTIQYAHGNHLAYVEYGDPNGDPILIQHGMIASIKDGSIFQHLVGAGKRLIGIARPGYGDSSPYKMKSIGEWGGIVAALAAELGLAQFDVLGISSGAPYSYAIAYALPEQVRSLYILSGTPALYTEAVRAGWPYPVTPEASLAELQKLAYELFFAGLSPVDLETDAIQDSLRNDCFGIALDLKLRVLDWGFRLEDVHSRTVMRHSQADLSVPFNTAKLTSRLLPNCRMEVRAEDPHFSQAVLDDFIQSCILGQPET